MDPFMDLILYDIDPEYDRSRKRNFIRRNDRRW